MTGVAPAFRELAAPVLGTARAERVGSLVRDVAAAPNVGELYDAIVAEVGQPEIRMPGW